LNPEPVQPERAMSAVASATEQAARTIIPQPVREISADIAAGVSDLAADAATVVNDIVDSVVDPKSKASKGTKKEGRTQPARKSTTKKATTPRSKSAPEM
jgi:hypothetical protein